MQKCKLLLFDLDGTLLQSDKTISKRTLSALNQCREKGILIGVSTSRSEQNSLVYLNELKPDILISSGGALVKYGTEYIYKAEFSSAETNAMIGMARTVCGNDCEITIDTIDAHYWNYKVDPKKLDQSWGDSIYTDFSDFAECSLKMCVEIFAQNKADELAKILSNCDCIRFSDGYWYKFTKKNVTKENAIMKITEVCGFGTDSMIAFGDDYADIGMLELCGVGVAMGNAIDEVKDKADIVIGSNDEDGIADFIESECMITVRRFTKKDAEEVSSLIVRNFLEVNSKDYGIAAMEKLAKAYNSEKVLNIASYAHMYVFELEDRIVGTGSISSFWGSKTESILLTIFVLPEYHGTGIGRKIINTLEQDELYVRATRIEIPASVTAVEFYRKFGYDYKNGVKELDEEHHYRLEKFKKVQV